jgi:hemerythrin-like domain-containing protein
MATITNTLIMEHAVFSAVFDQIEAVLPRLNSAQEVKVLATVVEGLLTRHAETEKNLAYAALDHVLEQKGELRRMHQDHEEIDNRFERVHGATELAPALRLFKKAIAASREHFRREEKSVFPLLEQILPGEALGDLGETWLKEYSDAAT